MNYLRTGLLLAGVITFLPKYMESQFYLPPSMVAIYVGW